MRRTVILVSFLACATAWADDPLELIPADRVAALAPRLVEAADKLPDPPFKVDADSDKASGVYKQGVGGLMTVPTKNLKADTLAGVQEPSGAPVGYLFLYELAPVVGGKPLEGGKLSVVNVKDDNGTERDIAVLRIAVKKNSDTEWQLLVFAKEKKPIVTAALRTENNGSDLPISVAAKETGNEQGVLTVTMFGKYAAEVPLGKLP
jgi:hypothetical protein